MTEELLRQLASTGLVGTLLVLSLVALYKRDGVHKTEIEKKDAELKAERDARLEEKGARIADARDYAERLNLSQKEVTIIASSLGKVAEAQEREREDRDRLERELRFYRPTSTDAMQAVTPQPRKR